MILAKVTAANSNLNSWTMVYLLVGGYIAAVVALFAAGRGRPSERISNSLERLTKMPAWAAAMMFTAIFGVFTAGQGFYADVAWHIALGRDKNLFTPPHTAIVIGLVFIGLSGVIGIATATMQGANVGFRVGRLRVPWSSLPLLALGGAAVSGFPLDDIWHSIYGIDVTMWSPTHMLMIVGASLTGLAAWLVLGEARVSPRDSGWARGAHVACAYFTLLGLAASQGEFTFGVPQFQQLYHPALVMIAGGFAFVVIRLVLGRWWGIGIALANLALFSSRMADGHGPVVTRSGGVYLASALAVELAAFALGTERRTRFALGAGIGVATIGFAGEYAWNLGARQPWNGALFPVVIPVVLLAAIGSAIVATSFSAAVQHKADRLLPPALVVAGGLAVVASLVIPFPRHGNGPTGAVQLQRVGNGNALVHVTLTPANAAKGAHWFQATTWQGGTLVLADMKPEGNGRYVSSKPLPVDGPGKTLVRLHTGYKMVAIPVHMPADPELNIPEIPAVDRTSHFVREGRYLMRESHGGAAWFAILITVLLTGVAILWAGVFSVVARRIAHEPDASTPAPQEREHALVA